MGFYQNDPPAEANRILGFTQCNLQYEKLLSHPTCFVGGKVEVQEHHLCSQGKTAPKISLHQCQRTAGLSSEERDLETVHGIYQADCY